MRVSSVSVSTFAWSSFRGGRLQPGLRAERDQGARDGVAIDDGRDTIDEQRIGVGGEGGEQGGEEEGAHGPDADMPVLGNGGRTER